jgi:SAM-dependent methyltransferase
VSGEASPEPDPPSAFFLEHAERLAQTVRLGPTLDLACGGGRHALAAAGLGLTVVALDRDPDRLATWARAREAASGRISILAADLEGPTPPALEAGSFGAVLVFRYLHRPLTPWIASLLAPGGVLLYETFTVAQRRLGWGPRRDDFLLEPGELPRLFLSLDIELYEEGLSRDGLPAHTGRLLARRRE